MKLLVLFLLTLILIGLGVLVWPTLYRYEELKQGDSVFPVRINRINGTAEILSATGWRAYSSHQEKAEPQSEVSKDAESDLIPAKEVTALTGQATIVNGEVLCDLYNGSTYDVREIMMGISVQDRNGKELVKRIYRLKPKAGTPTEPLQSAKYSAPLGFDIRSDQKWEWSVVAASGSQSNVFAKKNPEPSLENNQSRSPDPGVATADLQIPLTNEPPDIESLKVLPLGVLRLSVGFRGPDLLITNYENFPILNCSVNFNNTQTQIPDLPARGKVEVDANLFEVDGEARTLSISTSSTLLIFSNQGIWVGYGMTTYPSSFTAFAPLDATIRLTQDEFTVINNDFRGWTSCAVSYGDIATTGYVHKLEGGIGAKGSIILAPSDFINDIAPSLESFNFPPGQYRLAGILCLEGVRFFGVASQ